MKKVIILALAVFALGSLSYAANVVPEKNDVNSSETIVIDNETSVVQDLQANTLDLKKGMPYKELKKIYNPKEYIRDVSDPYNSGVAGVCSFFIPGLGQIIAGEVGRGLLIVGGAALLGGITYGAASAASYDGSEAGAGVALMGSACILALDIWSIFDAVKVAKIKNMYNQDLRKLFTDNNINISLSPTLAYVPMSNGLTPTAGVALRVTF